MSAEPSFHAKNFASILATSPARRRPPDLEETVSLSIDSSLCQPPFLPSLHASIVLEELGSRLLDFPFRRVSPDVQDDPAVEHFGAPRVASYVAMMGTAGGSGMDVGLPVVGEAVGALVGSVVVGDRVGGDVGELVGAVVILSVGGDEDVGAEVGPDDGTLEGISEGRGVGLSEG